MLNLFFLSLFACDVINSFTKSPAERLIDFRTQRTQTMNNLYASYGGGSLSNEIHKETDKDIEKEENNTGNKFLKAFQNTVSEIDRSVFEAHCLKIGNGHHAEIITEKSKTFFIKPETLASCKSIAILDIKISELKLQAGLNE